MFERLSAVVREHLFADSRLDDATRMAFRAQSLELAHRRVSTLLPVGLVAHVVSLIAVSMALSQGAAERTPSNLEGSAVHAVAILVTAALTFITWFERDEPRYPSVYAFMLFYLLFGAWLSLAEQTSAPFIISLMVAAVLLPMGLLASTVLLGLGFLALLAGQVWFWPGAQVDATTLEAGVGLIFAWFGGRVVQSGRASAFAKIETLTIHEKELEKVVHIDPLTQLPNRRAFLEQADRMCAHSRRHGDKLVAMMVDLDHFKDVNDVYGHMTGDDVLNAVACSMQSLLRVEDLVARYGGDELSAILGGCELEQATVVAERLRRHVMALRLPGGATISIGLAVVDVTRADAIMHALEAADHALYQSKGRGRNRVSVAEEEVKEPERPSIRIEASSRV